MRHLLGFVLAIIAGAALFFGAGWGVAKLVAINGNGEKLASLHGAEALGAVGGAALLIGLLMVIPRVSPLAAGLAGLAALGYTAWWVSNPRQAIGHIPLRSSTEAVGFAIILTSGLLGLIGLMAALTLFIPSRWRSYREAAYEEEDDADSDITATGLLG
jgi:hypothetical protein